MKPELSASIKALILELIIYGLLVTGYFFFVLHLLGGFLEHTFEHSRRTYAALGLGLIIAQGFALELLTRFLLSWVLPPKREEEP